MTDIELIEKKLAFIETCVRELRTLCDPENIERDVREIMQHHLDDLLNFAGRFAPDLMPEICTVHSAR